MARSLASRTSSPTGFAAVTAARREIRKGGNEPPAAADADTADAAAKANDALRAADAADAAVSDAADAARAAAERGDAARATNADAAAWLSRTPRVRDVGR